MEISEPTPEQFDSHNEKNDSFSRLKGVGRRFIGWFKQESTEQPIDEQVTPIDEIVDAFDERSIMLDELATVRGEIVRIAAQLRRGEVPQDILIDPADRAAINFGRAGKMLTAWMRLPEVAEQFDFFESTHQMNLSHAEILELITGISMFRNKIPAVISKVLHPTET